MISRHKRKRGRPRQPGERYRNGHLKKARRRPLESPASIAAGMPHRKALGDKALDQRAESELGRLVLRGELADVLATAGETYAALWRGYVATLGGPSSLSEGHGRDLACAGCPSPADPKYCVCWFRARVYQEADDVLTSTGSGVRSVVHTVAIHDRPCPAGGMDNLIRGLSVLAVKFGLTTRRILGQKVSSSPIRPLPACAGTGSEP
jgi:hypothetical protein